MTPTQTTETEKRKVIEQTISGCVAHKRPLILDSELTAELRAMMDELRLQAEQKPTARYITDDEIRMEWDGEIDDNITVVIEVVRWALAQTRPPRPPVDPDESIRYEIEIDPVNEDGLYLARWVGDDDGIQGAGENHMQAIACLAASTYANERDESARWVQPFVTPDPQPVTDEQIQEVAAKMVMQRLRGKISAEEYDLEFARRVLALAGVKLSG